MSSIYNSTIVDDPRQERGLQIAAMTKLSKNGTDWIVPSQAGTNSYRVNVEEQRCTCPDFELRRLKCKHIYAVEITIKRETSPDGTVTETKTVKVTYSQNWPAYNQA